MEEQFNLSNFIKRKNKKNHKIQDFQEIEGFDDIQIKNDIVIPESFEDEITNDEINVIVNKNTKRKIGSLDYLLSISETENNEEINVVEKTIHQISSEIPEEVEVIELAEELVTEVLPDIPDGDSVTNIDDLKIVTKDIGKGYIKTKVTIKGSKILSDLASSIKKQTDGDVVHRAMDLRNIRNTNRNQLKNSEYKLYTKSYLFKSKSIIRKYNRICISTPDDNKNKVILFFQESANKAVYELPFKSQKDIDFVIDIISNYFSIGFVATKVKVDNLFIDSTEEVNPFTNLLTIIAKTKQYRLKHNNERLLIGGKSQKNLWLGVVIEMEAKNSYSVNAKSLIEKEWNGIKLLEQNVTIEYLERNILSLLDEWFNYRDFSKEYDTLDDENKYFMMYKKLRYKKLRKALDVIVQRIDENNNTNCDILKTIARDEVDLTKQGKYEPEVIIGTSNTYKNWMLSYSAVQVIGGDKRKGSDYITTDDYYEREGVNDKRDYSERKRTILSRQNNQRNYNSRPYMFTLDLIKHDGTIQTINNKESDNLIDLIFS